MASTLTPSLLVPISVPADPALAPSFPERVGSRIITAADLMAAQLPPIRWIVPELLPEGLTILAGKPKMGKSWLALALGLAVASGTEVLGRGPLERGPVLYLALEDHDRRLQRRLALLLDDTLAPDLLELLTVCPRLHEGGLAIISEWLRARAGARLVIIDTLAKVRPPTPAHLGMYEADYEALGALKHLADTYAIALVLIHHLRKQAAADVFDQVSGSTGLTGAADGTLILNRDRGSGEAVLHVTGRDVDERQVHLTFDRERALWLAVEAGAESADGLSQSQQRQDIMRLLRDEGESGPLTPAAIADRLGRDRDAVRKMLAAMLAAGQIISPSRGLYTVPPASAPAEGQEHH
jgi:hypothetical protein